jgi:hypothetical protein
MMDDHKNEPVFLNGDTEAKLCLQCGFPNRNTDSACMYCRNSLIAATGLISWFRQTCLVLKWRWELKQKKHGLIPSARRSVFSIMCYFIAGFLLTAGGVLLLVGAVSNHSFSDGLISVLFLLYGGNVLKTILFPSR